MLSVEEMSTLARQGDWNGCSESSGSRIGPSRDLAQLIYRFDLLMLPSPSKLKQILYEIKF